MAGGGGWSGGEVDAVSGNSVSVLSFLFAVLGTMPSFGRGGAARGHGVWRNPATLVPWRRSASTWAGRQTDRWAKCSKLGVRPCTAAPAMEEGAGNTVFFFGMRTLKIYVFGNLQLY